MGGLSYASFEHVVLELQKLDAAEAWCEFQDAKDKDKHTVGLMAIRKSFDNMRKALRKGNYIKFNPVPSIQHEGDR